jgi:hypothetical protein
MYTDPDFVPIHSELNPNRMNTYKKSCCNSIRMNTYKAKQVDSK